MRKQLTRNEFLTRTVSAGADTLYDRPALYRQTKKQMDNPETFKAKKIIKAHGVPVHNLEAMEAAAESPWVDVIHVRVNPYGEAMDKKDPALVIPVIDKLHVEDKDGTCLK